MKKIVKKRESFPKKTSLRLKEKEMSDREIAVLARRLVNSLGRKEKTHLADKAKKVLEYPGVKEILVLLGAGSFLVLSAAMPGVPVIAKAILDGKSDKDWKKYNQWYLRRTLKRLKEQKMIDFDFEGEKIIVKLNNRGRKRILKYSLEKIEIKKPIIWDRKWRLIIYDVPNEKRKAADDLNRMLSDLGMYRMQRSVFICPFPCEDEVEFLREYLGISEHVWLLTVARFENDKVFREYFGI